MPQVVLNYDSANTAVPFGPSPRRIQVKPGDALQFEIGAGTRGAKPGCKLRITLHQPQHFSARVLEHSGPQTGAEALTLNVLPTLAAVLTGLADHANFVITAYRCELLDSAFQPIPGLVSDGHDGGEIVPDTSGV